MNDRGIIKWAPFNSVVNSKSMIKSIVKEKSKIKMPTLSLEEKQELEEIIINSYYMHNTINIYFYNNGYIFNEKGKIKKIDKIYKIIYLNNNHIHFNQIIKITCL